MMRFAYTITLYLLLVGPLAAQITFTAENYVRPDSYVDSVYFAPLSSVALPDTGADMVWDFSALPTDSISSINVNVAGTDTAFAEATSYFDGIVRFAELFPVPIRIWTGKADDGFREYGYTSTDVKYSVTPLTGAPGDSIRWVGGNTVYTNRGELFVEFPTTFGTKFTTEWSQTTNYELTAAGLGLSETPGSLKGDYSLEREIVGWGTLILPGVEGGESTSYEVLQRRTITTIVDSLFLFGAPAPPALVAAFGQVQGNVRRDTSFSFLGLTEISGRVLLSYCDCSDGYRFRPTSIPSNATSVSTPRLVHSKVYPNPVTAGGTLSFDFATDLQAGTSVRIVALDGREVYRRQLPDGRNERVTVNLPADLPASLYIYAFHDRSGRLLASGKIRTR